MAQFQADIVIGKLKWAFPDIDVQKCIISADADKHEGSLMREGGKGAFVSRLDHALVQRELDIAVNCLKDIPNSHERQTGIIVAGVLARDEVIDVAITRTGAPLKDLPPNSTVGTVAPRRIAQVTRNYPQLKCVHFRGSADTRIAKLDAGAVDAVILASSGLERIGMRDRATEELPEDVFPPAFGAGVVTMDCLAERQEIKAVIQQLNHEETQRCMDAERAFVNAIYGNCATAMAGIAKCDEENRTCLRVVLYSHDGKAQLKGQDCCVQGKEIEMGKNLAMSMESKGSKRIMQL